MDSLENCVQRQPSHAMMQDLGLRLTLLTQGGTTALHTRWPTALGHPCTTTTIHTHRKNQSITTRAASTLQRRFITTPTSPPGHPRASDDTRNRK